jgi:hypothetical protein
MSLVISQNMLLSRRIIWRWPSNCFKSIISSCFKVFFSMLCRYFFFRKKDNKSSADVFIYFLSSLLFSILFTKIFFYTHSHLISVSGSIIAGRKRKEFSSLIQQHEVIKAILIIFHAFFCVSVKWEWVLSASSREWKKKFGVKRFKALLSVTNITHKQRKKIPLWNVLKISHK